jgi:cytoskeletal protein CcmA (bactofilin family)
MFGSRKKFNTSKVDTLIGRHSEIYGDVRFSGGLHVDGTVKGNILAEEDPGAFLNLSEHGTVEGGVKVPNVVLNGVVVGDVHARQHIVLAANARVTGNVYYSLIEMAMGAEVNGNLVHTVEEVESPLKLGHRGTLEVAEES